MVVGSDAQELSIDVIPEKCLALSLLLSLSLPSLFFSTFYAPVTVFTLAFDRNFGCIVQGLKPRVCYTEKMCNHGVGVKLEALCYYASSPSSWSPDLSLTFCVLNSCISRSP